MKYLHIFLSFVLILGYTKVNCATKSYATSSNINGNEFVTKVMGIDKDQEIKAILAVDMAPKVFERLHTIFDGNIDGVPNIPDEVTKTMADYFGSTICCVISDKLKEGIVAIIDPASHERININVGKNPVHGTIVGTTLYIVNNGSDNVSVIDITSNTKMALLTK